MGGLIIHYLATIKYTYDSQSKTFDTVKEAEQWLDSINNNLQYTTFITEYNNKWERVGGFVYTEEAK